MLAITLYLTLKALHVLAAIVWVGGAIWSFGTTWILFALVVFGGSFALGAGFIGPESGRIVKPGS